LDYYPVDSLPAAVAWDVVVLFTHRPPDPAKINVSSSSSSIPSGRYRDVIERDGRGLFRERYQTEGRKVENARGRKNVRVR